MTSNEITFEYITWQYLEKTIFFLPAIDAVTKLIPDIFYFPYVKICEHTKSNLMIYNLSMLKKWISVVLCFRLFLITELEKILNISFQCDFQIMVF